jgi:hypothetical protein
MNLKEKYKDDIAMIMSKINHNGANYGRQKTRKLAKEALLIQEMLH